MESGLNCIRVRAAMKGMTLQKVSQPLTFWNGHGRIQYITDLFHLKAMASQQCNTSHQYIAVSTPILFSTTTNQTKR